MNADKIINTSLWFEVGDELPIEVHCFEWWEEQHIWAEGYNYPREPYPSDSFGTVNVLEHVEYKVYSEGIEISEILNPDEVYQIILELENHYPLETRFVL